MKKTILIGAVVGLVVAVVMFSMAAAPTEKEMTKGKEGMMEMGSGCTMMSSTGKMMHACPMHAMMMKSMMDREMVATSDGGVIIMHCGKLTKYDKDLNMVKEAEMKMDPEAMKKIMTQMMEACPMCKKMTERAEMMEKGKMMEKSEPMEKTMK